MTIRRLQTRTARPEGACEAAEGTRDGGKRLTVAIATAPATKVVRLPAKLVAIYWRAVAQLKQHVAGEEAAHARDTIRALIDRIVIRPSEQGEGPLAMAILGDLFRMLDLASAATDSSKAGSTNGNRPQLEAGGV